MSQRVFLSSWRLVLLLCVASAGSACSSFNSRWSALQEQGGATDVGVQGRWEGRWNSVPSGHAGALRCIVTPAKDGTVGRVAGEDYLFSFSATWGPGIVSDYDIPMKVVQQPGGRSTFTGETDLGFFMGVYRCEGSIDRDKFFSTYDAKIDHGTFEMTRPVAPPR